MDMVMVDVTGIPEVTEEDPVVLLGPQGAEVIPADAWAVLAETVSYEILCGISPRVPRLYVGGEETGALEPTTPRIPPRREGPPRPLPRRAHRRRAP
jgi:alanine racemase